MTRYLQPGDLELDESRSGRIPVVTAPTGSGKSHLVASGELREILEEHYGQCLGATLVLEANSATKEQLIEDGAEEATWEDMLSYPGTGTYAACFSLLAGVVADGWNPDVRGLVVVDEADELARWSLCHEGNTQAWAWLVEQHRMGRVFLVLLTATPKLLLDYMDREWMDAYDATPGFPLAYTARRVEIVPHGSAKTAVRALRIGTDSRALVYTREAGRAARLSEWLSANGIKSAFLVSKYNDKEDGDGKTLAQKMLEQECADGGVRDYVLSKRRFPDEVEVLVINDACATGMTIEDDRVRHVVVESTELETVLQVKGRMRQDVDSLTVCYNRKELKRVTADIAEYNCAIAAPPEARLEYQKAASAAGEEPNLIAYEDPFSRRAEVNPFARAVYQERLDAMDALFGDESGTRRSTYWHALLPHSAGGYLAFTSNEEMLARAANAERAAAFEFEPWLGRKLFCEDRKELARVLGLRTKKRERASWTTAKRALEALGYKVKDGNTRRDGKPVRYSIIS